MVDNQFYHNRCIDIYTGIIIKRTNIARPYFEPSIYQNYFYTKKTIPELPLQELQ